MQRKIVNTAALVMLILMLVSFAAIAFAQDEGLSHSGGTPSGPGDPNLQPLPAGVTPAYTIATTAYLSFRPNPIGVGQSLLINVWTSPGMYHSFYMCQYKVTIQKPDGSTDVLGPLNSYLGDATAWWEYIPEEPGTYKLKFEQPGTYLPAKVYYDRPPNLSANYTLYQSVYYTASSTDWQELTVQSDMVASWPPAPLPTDYWTRPIYPDKREWWPISGNYPWAGIYYYPGGRMLYPSNYRFTAYVQAPNSAHVVWRRQGALSGLIGGEAYQNSFTSGGGTPDIIYAGRCYDTVTKVANSLTNGTYYDQPVSVWQCYDLRTGEIYWENTIVNAPPTDILYEAPGVSSIPGAEASSNWAVSLVAITNPSGTNPGRLIKYNPYTGAVTSNVTCQPVGLTAARPGIVSPGGEYGSYLHNNTRVYSFQNLGTAVPVAQRYRLIEWDARGTTTNFTARILSNISFPRNSLGAVDFEAGVAVTVQWAVPPGPQWCIGLNMTGTDLKTGVNTFEYATNDTISENIQTLSSPVADRGKLALAMQNMHWNCYDLRTGRKLWQSEQTSYPWGNWWPYATASYDINETKGCIISGSYAGVYAFDWDNGKILWHYADPDVPFESPYGNTPFQSGCRIADGKVYIYNTEHSASQPATRGWKLYCLNAATGELLWKILGPMSPGAVADGYLTASNSYDGYMYVFGRGKSATTVTAPDVAVPLGTAFTIKGTVLDQSPGQPGTPCVSKDSMETQMEYLHMSRPIDGLWHNESITGVPVTLTAIGSDGSVIDLGSVTTNGYYGTFSKAWTPPKEDTYTIIASFGADDSYGSSNAATAVTVGPAPAPYPETPEAPTPPDYTMLLYGILVAVIIAIVLALVLIFRKR